MAALPDFQMQAHDLLPVIQGTASSHGAPIDLTGAVSVKFIMRSADSDFKPIMAGQAKVNAAAAFFAPLTGGTLVYNWVTGDTDVPGNYVGQFQIMWPSSKPQTVPTTTYITISILADLDNA